MTKEGLHIYFLGTAGAGKSSLVGAYLEWCRQSGIDAIAVNLDPGAESLPYAPDLDVREWIRTRTLMETDRLGPNGAQIAASDLVALRAAELQKRIEQFRCDQVLIDTPGQIELFVFRQSGKHIADTLAPDQSLIAYLIDPILARSASSFVSQILLSASVQLRLGLPTTHLLSKADLLQEEELDTILRWSQEPETLESAVQDEQASMARELNVGLLRTIESAGSLPSLHPVSASEGQGLEDVYAALQQIYHGGEDITADATDTTEPARG